MGSPLDITVHPARKARPAPAATAHAPAPGSAAGTAGEAPWPELWARLRAHLQARATELSAEVRHYPGPIARCDDQLPKLLEQRTHAYALLRALDEAAPAGIPSAAALREVLLAGGRTDDDTEAALRSALLEALDAVRRAGYARRD